MEEKVWLAYPVTEQIHITAMYSLFKIHYNNGFAFHGEAHNFWECFYVIDGEVCVSADERVYNLMRGEIIVHKPLEFHKFIVNGPKGATVLIFSFSAEGPLTGWLRDKVFSLSNSQNQILKSLISYMQSKADGLGLSPQKYYDCLKPFEQLPYYSQMIITYLYQLFLSLSDEGTISSVSSAPDAVTFSKAISYLNCNLHRQPSVREIAKFSNVSEASLKRIFDKYAGISVHKYLLKLKIKVAMELLQDGESVCMVAERLGFNSQSYFSKAFKRETGFNPSDLKQS
ncbi:MAG: helix-turn-helix transcriptional regulator [Lachnospiraceae bacterium]|nr:helix-turn-helix transcriptional regulator [Lachnospiraceae bacterium]